MTREESSGQSRLLAIDPEDLDWVGRGKVRLARDESAIWLRYWGLSTHGGKLREPLVAFFRKDYRMLKPSYQHFEVSIHIEREDPALRFDVDNVAKACLDALNGIAWYDDSQVQKLTVEKTLSERTCLTIHLRTYAQPET